MERSGIAVYPKPFMALRASRRTELERSGRHPNHVLNDWFGHSGAIAETHYLQVTEADFTAAIASENVPTERSVGTVVGTSGTDQDQSASHGSTKKPGKSQVESDVGGVQIGGGIPPRGFEPLTFGSVDRCSIQLS